MRYGNASRVLCGMNLWRGELQYRDGVGRERVAEGRANAGHF